VTSRAGRGAFVSVEGLTKAYRGGWGCHDVSVDVPRGVIAALGGPNGSGKSTLLRCIAGLATYDGMVRLNGVTLGSDPRPRARIGYLPQTVAFPEHLTIGEVVGFFADLRGVDPVDTPLPAGFVRDEDDRIGELSGGQRHRVALAVALLGAPDLLLLDEPVANLDEEGREGFWAVLRSLRDRHGVTSIVSSPSPSELRGVADRALYMDDGRLVLEEDLSVEPRGVGSPDGPEDLLEACS
jgi:ABC-type multidrug transport system ATPase subunit